MLNLTDAQEAYVREVVKDVPFLAFNRATGTFEVSDAITDPTWDQLRVLGKATRRLCHQRPPPPVFCSVPLNRLITGYYDHCLEYYCYERLNLNLSHEQTCWVRFAERTYCLGKIDPVGMFDDDAKVNFLEKLAREESDNYVAMSTYRAYRRDSRLLRALKKDNEGWVLLLADIPIGPFNRRRRLVASAKDWTKKLLRFPRDDRVLQVVHSIKAHGWDNDLSWVEPEGGAVLGYSRTTECYFALTGRHRLAAAKYLYSQGKLSGSTLLEFPVITYSWGPWRQGRPHPDSSVCEWCERSAVHGKPD